MYTLVDYIFRIIEVKLPYSGICRYMNNEELKSLYREQMPRVYKFFYYKTLSRADSEDLTSETFLQFVEKSQSTAINERVKYLWGIANNVFTNYLRIKYRVQFTDFDEEQFQDYAEEFITDRESIPTIEERALPYINQLPESQKIVANLRLIEKNSLTDICLILNKDMNYVKTTQKRALHSLRKIVACTPEPTNIITN